MPKRNKAEIIYLVFMSKGELDLKAKSFSFPFLPLPFLLQRAVVVWGQTE